MTHRKLVATTSLLIVAATALLAAPAHAAAGDAPTVVEIGGKAVDQRTMQSLTLRDVGQRPSFTAMARSASQVGSLMTITDLNSGVGCQATIRADRLASCVPTADIPFGRADIEAHVTRGDGEASEPNDSLQLNLGMPTPTVRLDSYDPATKTARVSGTAEAPSVTVSNVTSSQGTTTDPVTREWHATLPIVDPQSAITTTIGADGVLSVGRTWLPEAQLAPPIVTATVSGRSATLHIEGSARGFATIYDATGNVIGGGDFVDGATDATVRIPGGEARYTVTQQTDGGPESDPASVDVHGGLGETTPSSPVIGSVFSASNRLVVPVSGAKGAVVTIRAIDGRPVGVRALGASGTTQVVIAAPAAVGASARVFTAEQTIDGSVSPIAVFTAVQH